MRQEQTPPTRNWREPNSDRLQAIRGHDHRFLLAVTGGVASGKSTVAEMLRLMGAATIDTDVIARQVVERGKPAWQEIVAHFGERFLDPGGELDRKRLAKVVFADRVQRRKLESITHPRIMEELLRQVNAIARDDPQAIIQVVVPLLLEGNLQSLFHKTVVVYVSRLIQLERLMTRDGISEEEAGKILSSQWPIDDKLSYADFVIRNEGSIEETRKQVEELWGTVQAMQTARIGG